MIAASPPGSVFTSELRVRRVVAHTMPYREPPPPPRVPRSRALWLPIVVFVMAILAVAPWLRNGDARRWFREMLREAGLAGTVLVAFAAITVVTLAASTVLATRRRTAVRFGALFAPAIVSVVAWGGMLLPLPILRGEFFAPTAEFVGAIRSAALLSLTGLLTAITAFAAVAATICNVWKCHGAGMTRRRLLRAIGYSAVPGGLAFLVALAALARFANWPGIFSPSVMPAWFTAIGVASIVFLRVLLRAQGAEHSSGWFDVAIASSLTIVAVLADARSEQLSTESTRLCCLWVHWTYLKAFEARASLLLDAHEVLVLVSAFALPFAIALVVAAVRAVRAAPPNPQRTARIVIAVAAAVVLPSLAMRSLHAREYDLQHRLLNWPAEFDEHDLSLPRIDRDLGSGPIDTIGIGRTNVWWDGRPILPLSTLGSVDGRRAFRNRFYSVIHPEYPWDHAPDYGQFVQIAIDQSHPARVLASVLDAIRDGRAIRCGLEFAFPEDRFAHLPDWLLRGVRLPRGAVDFEYGDDGSDAASASTVRLERHRMLVTSASGASIEIERGRGEVDKLHARFADATSPERVRLVVGATERTDSLVAVLAAIESQFRTIELRVETR